MLPVIVEVCSTAVATTMVCRCLQASPPLPKPKASSMEVEGAALAEDSAMQEPGAKVGAAPGVQARQTLRKML